ncbi:universal stress protein A-like protein isoform X2 [Punica granatum]|uniref:Universal stress protein A-like protein isoform X2 n=2 Tax=Punica granatum TaxID=22663 RepID=A0A6P8CWQ1_PUNGR|nr:universal stress protein A-like protein isoform X2 [Punica granatum]
MTCQQILSLSLVLWKLHGSYINKWSVLMDAYFHQNPLFSSQSIYRVLSESYSWERDRIMAEGGAAAAAASENKEERRIVVAVDESEESMYALTWCLKNLVSSNFNDTLFLVYANNPPPVYTAVDGSGYLFSSDIIATMERYGGEVAESVMEKAKKICRDLGGGDDDQIKVETRVERGDARDVICKMVERLNADILVMGSHGYGLIKRAFLGSVSNHCAQNVKSPVMIVKKPK